MLGMYQGRRYIAKHYLELSFWFCREQRFFRGSYYLLKALKLIPFQNPAYLIGICFAVIDSLFKTSLATQALACKHTIENEFARYRK
jgi:hypothetical protein